VSLRAAARPVVALAVALVLAAVAPVGAGAAGAGAGAGAVPGLALAGQPAWVRLGTAATLRLHVAPSALPPGEEVSVRLRLHDRVRTMDDFEDTFDGEDLPDRIGPTIRLPLAALSRDATGAVLAPFGVGESDLPIRFSVFRGGVYPLEVALEADDELASFVTWIVVVDPEDLGERLRVAWVWPVVSEPVRGADLVADPTVERELERDGRLARVAAVLDAAGTMPATLQLSPETLESWQAIARTDRTRAAALASVLAAAARPSTALLTVPYVPIDLPALEAAGLGGELAGQLLAGGETLERLTGDAPDPRLAFAEPVDAASLDRLRELFVGRVVVRDTRVALDDEEDAFETFALPAGDGQVRAAATSALVDRLLAGSEPLALRVQRAVTGLALVAFDEPDEPRGVVLAPPERFDPDVALYTSLVAAMRGHPLLAPVTLDDFFDEVRSADVDGAPVVRQLLPAVAAPFPIADAEYATARADLESLRSTVPDGSDVVRRGARALQLALSTAQTPERARAHLSVVAAGIERLVAGVATTRKRVTVTARRADIPLSFENDSGLPLRVRVQLASVKLRFPDGNGIVVELPEGNSTQQFSVEARASGTFTMTVTVTTVDGRVALGAPARVTVRSAVFSGVGGALTLGALVFLALWWANHLRRTRRARRAHA
jgi:hypothetical protein